GYFTLRDLDDPYWWWSWERYWGYAYDHKVDRIEFSDGRVFSLEEFIKEKGLVLRGTEEDDHLIGQEGKDFIYGEGGNDRIYGGEGDDTLVGGSGDDYLEGGPGNDTYIFKPGDGQDWIQDVEGENKIVFGTGIKGEEVEFAREKDEMIFNLGDGEEIRIASWPRVYEHFSFEFADGKRLKGEDIEARGYPIYGSPYDDFLEGTSGNDRIEGRGGRDVLLGGKGDDILEGGPGSDTYIFHPGDGKDVILDTTLNVPVEGGEIQETGSQPGMPPLIPGFMFEFSEMMPVDGERYFEGESNRVVLGEGVKRNEVVFFRRGEDLVLMYGEGDYVKIRDQFARGGVEWIELEDGAYLSRETISEIVETVNGLRDDGVTDLGRKYRELIGDQGLMEIIAGSWTDFSNPVQILRQPGMVLGGV
ncbi:MAG TPA: calcium-binding protein, partial [Thermosulfurimonas dismutans]|nr:calcium-binding protein [Thermosulfurimonas dismutans]